MDNTNETPTPDAVEELVAKHKTEDTVQTMRDNTVSRTTFNYVIVAIVFFAVGLVMGSFVFPNGGGQSVALSAEIEAVVRDAVNEALATAGVVEEPGLVMGEVYDFTLDLSEDPFLGSPDAPVTIVEFSDFTCGFCGRFALETLHPLLEEYEGQVRLVYVDYPFLSQMSLPAAVAGECAHEQDRFWEMHDALFANQRNLSPDGILVIADSLALDMEAFSTCYEAQTPIEEIREDFNYGRELGVSGTPAFFVNGTFVSGAQPLEVFRQIIDEELAAIG